VWGSQCRRDAPSFFLPSYFSRPFVLFFFFPQVLINGSARTVHSGEAASSFFFFRLEPVFSSTRISNRGPSSFGGVGEPHVPFKSPFITRSLRAHPIW